MNSPLSITASDGIYTLSAGVSKAVIGDLAELKLLAAAMEKGWPEVVACWGPITNSPAVSGTGGQVIPNLQVPPPAAKFFQTTNCIVFRGNHVFKTTDEKKSLYDEIQSAGKALADCLKHVK